MSDARADELTGLAWRGGDAMRGARDEQQMTTARARAESAVAVRKEGLNWGTSIFIVIFHIGAVGALFFWSWQAFLVTLLLWWISGSLGIGMGYHRLLTHRGYQVPKWLEYFLAVCGTLALEGSPVHWVTTHRLHHAHADSGGDPHSPRDGRWWSHIGWILVGTAQQHDRAVLERYAPDLMKDRFYRWLLRWWFLPLVTVGLLLWFFGGFGMLLWGIFLRTTFGLHATWLVNSATHMWGTQRFKTSDDSRNNWWVALLTFGEGWHNNHHAHPRSARHGLRWYEIDLNWYGIRALQLLRLAKSIKLTREAAR